MEGACSGSTCRNNNPGNLRAGPGATGVDSRGIAIFPDLATGEAALQHQVDLNIGRGLTLDEFFGGKAGVYAGYAPAADSNNPSAYASTVAGWLNIPENSPLASLGAGSASIPLDASATIDFQGPVDTSGSDLSTMALVGLALAGIGIVWAVAS
jgi:hypothetical protein